MCPGFAFGNLFSKSNLLPEVEICEGLEKEDLEKNYDYAFF